MDFAVFHRSVYSSFFFARIQIYIYDVYAFSIKPKFRLFIYDKVPSFSVLLTEEPKQKTSILVETRIKINSRYYVHEQWAQIFDFRPAEKIPRSFPKSTLKSIGIFESIGILFNSIKMNENLLKNKKSKEDKKTGQKKGRTKKTVQ